jgi:DNA-binding transcriptional LysR family regulator
MIELRQLQYFLAVAERLSITDAARDLQMAQPALSQAITKMERQLGAVLFDRSRRRLRLTAAGATLVPEARQLVSRARVLQSVIVSATAASPVGAAFRDAVITGAG